MQRGNFLDESSGSSSEDYRSPESNPDQTNYSLEFTHSRAGLRSSYGRGRDQSEQPSTSQQAARQLQSTSRRAEARGPTARRGRPRQTASANPRNVQQTPRTPPQRRRKQRRPLSIVQKEQRFLRDLKKLQSQTTPLVPRRPFSRLIRQIIFSCTCMVERITPDALAAIQEATEMYITHVLADAYLLSLHRGRLTLLPKDMELLNLLRGGI